MSSSDSVIVLEFLVCVHIEIIIFKSAEKNDKTVRQEKYL